MKTSKKIGILLALGLLLGSCAPLAQKGSSSSPVASISSLTSQESSDASPAFSSPVSEESSSLAAPQKNGVYEFYGVNDFHGAIEERNNSYYENGLKKYFSYLKEKKDADPDHVFVFSAGDMFQGTYESNFNYGQLVTEAMNAVPFDAMAVGNHEFDYGVDKLQAILDKAEFPILAGNIVKHGTNEPWSRTSISAVLEKGALRVGVVGFVGEGQTTSIMSKNVGDLDFTNQEALAEAEALRLREEEHCDAVIYLVHDDSSKIQMWNDSTHLKKYFDGCFTAHTHKKNDAMFNGVPAVQSYCNGEYYSHFTLQYEDGVVTCLSHGLENVSASTPIDPVIEAVYDKYITPEVDAYRSREAGTIAGTMSKADVARLCCRSAYEELKETYPDLVLTMVNSQRATLSGRTTYSNIYQATPFMNYFVLARVPGSDILRNAANDCTYTGDPEAYATIDANSEYLVGVIDYLFYHQNVSKKYDYFSSLNTKIDVVGEVGGDDDWPADFCYRYLHDAKNGSMDAAEVRGAANGFDLYA